MKDVLDLYHTDFCEGRLSLVKLAQILEGIHLESVPSHYHPAFVYFLSEMSARKGVRLKRALHSSCVLSGDISFRSSLSKDASSLVAFLHSFHREILGGTLDAFLLTRECIVAEGENTLVGALWYDVEHRQKQEVLFVRRLYVVPEKRKKGYGRDLLKYSFEREEGRCAFADLIAPDSALDFYLSLGFRSLQKMIRKEHEGNYFYLRKSL